MEKEPILNFSGLWAHEKRAGVYHAKLHGDTLWLRKNEAKTAEKDPDWILSISNEAKANIDLCGLYNNTSKAGTEYISGNWGQLRVMIFWKSKTEDREPNLNVTFSQRRKKE